MCRLILSKLKIYKSEFIRLLKIGVPAGIQGSLFAISNVIIQSSINSFGSVVMSGNAAAGNIEGFVYVAVYAVEQTTLNFTGQNYGAGEYKRITKIMKICMVLTTAVGTLLGLTAYFLSNPLLSIYITDSPKAIEYGVMRITCVCIPYMLCGLMDVMTGVIRGMGSSVAPMIISVLGICGFRIAWIYTVFAIPKYHTLTCLYISYPISWGLTFAVQFLAYLVIRRKKYKQSPKTAEEPCVCA